MKQETKGEVLERIFVKLSDMTVEDITKLVRRSTNSDVDSESEPRV